MIGNAWRFATAWPRGFIGWVHRAICALTDEQGRKGWAMLAALGCCVIETAIVIYVLWLVRRNPMLAFWIGLSSQGIVLIVVSGLMVLLGIKRKTNLNIPLPGGGSVSLGMDDQGAPVVVTSTPVPVPPPPPTPPPAPAPPSPQPPTPEGPAL
jgi:hypothetical protein